MARAYQQSQPPSDDHSPAEWQSLRAELVQLLDQIDGRVQSSRDPGVGERLADLRHQVAAGDEDVRHRDALRSVQRAINRFEETPPPAPPMPRGPNPRDPLQAAIDQIRSRQDNRPRVQAPPASYAPPAPPARTAEAPLFDKLAHSVNGLGGRLEPPRGENN